MNAPDRIEMMGEPDESALTLVEQPRTAVVQVQQPNNPAAIMALAIQQGAPVETIERMWALQVAWEEREARKSFTTAMAAFKAEPLTIFKRKAVGYNTKEGDFVGYKHAELSDVTDVVGPAMARHGLSYRWDVKQDAGRINVSCIVTHQLGHSEAVTMDAAPDSSGKKNAIQQIASAVQYLQRYTLLAATGMSTKGMDDDGKGSGAEGADDALQDFRDAALDGTPALRKHYEKVLPDDLWWAKHSKELKDAAKLVDSKVQP